MAARETSYSLAGAGGAPGLAIGPAARMPAEPPAAPPPDEAPEAALARLAEAQAAVAARMAGLADRERAAGREDPALIFEFLSFLAEDAALTAAVERPLREGAPLAEALDSAVAGLGAQIASLESDYHRERAEDIHALGRELRAALRGRRPALDLPPGAVLVAGELSPAEVADLPEHLAGLVTAEGSPTGHTAILARARGIPAVLGVGPKALAIEPGAELAVDGDSAEVLVAPEGPARAAFLARARARRASAALPARPCRLIDGRQVALLANVGHPDEVAAAVRQGAEGVGLFRTEFLFLGRGAPPSEEEQYAAYRAALDAAAGRPLVVRTLDIGGDKPVPYLEIPAEPNPALGLRGLRLMAARPDLLAPQLRALLRAAAHGDLRIMLPMVATPADMAWGRAQIAAAARALAEEGAEHRGEPMVGAMVETPAAAVTADLLAPHADFFSIGTNDLAQYALAADRGSAALAHDYAADAPAVLRLAAAAVEAAQAAGIPVAVCGELAGTPAGAAVLVGLGVGELSMAPAAIPGVRERLEQLSSEGARELAWRAARWGVARGT